MFPVQGGHHFPRVVNIGIITGAATINDVNHLFLDVGLVEGCILSAGEKFLTTATTLTSFRHTCSTVDATISHIFSGANFAVHTDSTIVADDNTQGTNGWRKTFLLFAHQGDQNQCRYFAV